MTVDDSGGVISSSDGDVEEPAVEDIDERRLNRRAYDYLCRLTEVRNWLCECLRDDAGIVPVTELEMNLSNGVVLARLGNSFAPETVPITKIFDIDQSRYSPEKQLHYRHTDNIMLWRRSMESVRLPEIFIPETADVYEGRNMKTIFCLYALAFHLYRQRKAPPIRNQAGNAVFSNDDMAVMKEHLKDSKMPEFGEVGGMLFDKMSSDEKAEALAVHAIAEAVDKNDPTALLIALQNPDAGILYVEGSLSDGYLVSLGEARKENKFNKALIQDTVIHTNNSWAFSRLDDLLLSPNSINRTELYAVFDALQIEDTRERAFPLYVRILEEKKRTTGHLTYDDVKSAVDEANALVEVKVAAVHGSSLDTYAALSLPALNLHPVNDNATLYHNRLRSLYQNADEGFFLSRRELDSILSEFSGLSDEKRKVLELNASCSRGDTETTRILLVEIFGKIIIEENVTFYMRKLQNVNEDHFDIDTVEKTIIDVNMASEKALRDANNLIDLNLAARSHDEHAVVRALESGKSSWDGEYRSQLIHWYAQRMMKEQQAKRNGTSNGHEAVEEWYVHEFPLGRMYVELSNRNWSSSEKQPQANTFLGGAKVNHLIVEGNAAFDDYYASHIDAVTKSQEATRKYLQRKKHLAEQREKDRQNEAAQTIQNNYKKYRFKKDTMALKSSDAPNLGLVRKFVTYLQDKDYDINEELEVEKAKARVTHLVVANQELDGDLRQLDEKIGLLIKNRINLEDVIADKNKISEAASRLAEMGSLRRKDKEITEALEQIFYHLQTDTAILANLLQETSRDRLDQTVSSTVAPIFGFLTETREEFLLVRLLCEIVERDIHEAERPDQAAGPRKHIVAEILNHSMFDSITPSRLSDVLQSELKEFFATEKKGDTFNLEPESIFQSVYGKKPADVQTAVDDQTVQQVLEESKSFLAEWSTRIMSALIARHKLPKPIRYLAMYAADSLRRKFPAASGLDIQKAVAELVYEAWISPSLSNARHLTSSLGREITQDGLQKMHAVTEFIQFAVSNKGYGNARWYLTSLNRQIHTIFEEFRQFAHSSLSSLSLDSIYGLNEYTQFNPARKPVLSLIGKHTETVIRTVNAEPGTIPPSLPALRSLITSMSSRFSSDPRPVILSSEADRPILLYLHPMTASGNEQKIRTQETFVRCKRYVVDLLLSGCVGADLPELLETKAHPEQENLHKKLFNEQPKFENIAAKQAEIVKLLGELEKDGRVQSADKYQDIVTDIANDIRQANQRRHDRAQQKKSLEDSERRLNRQREELRERLTQYEVYLETCLENLSRTSRRLSIRPTTEKAGKIQKARSSIEARVAHKSTLEKLIKKGVVVDNKVPGCENMKRAAKWSVEVIRSEKKGFFEIRVFDGKEMISDFNLDFQDLLQAQYRGEKIYNARNQLVFSVNDVIAHINKKFYDS